MSMSGRRVYLIPGRDERLSDSFGSAIADMSYSIQGREIVSGFDRLWFPEQLALIRSDLEKGFWNHNAILIGRSYGAYLLLHTLADMSPFPGRILLFSPVLGQAVAPNRNRILMSRPPRAERLYQLAKDNRFPAPRYLEIHTGAEDKGCDPLLAERFASLVQNTKLLIVAGMAHRLDQNYVQKVLNKFLAVATEDQKRLTNF